VQHHVRGLQVVHVVDSALKHEVYSLNVLHSIEEYLANLMGLEDALQTLFQHLDEEIILAFDYLVYVEDEQIAAAAFYL